MATSSRRLKNFTSMSTVFFDLDNTLIPTMHGDKMACSKVQRILIDTYGLAADEANSATQTFLKHFRKCPESVEMPLDDWRMLLWNRALGDRYSHFADEIYSEWLHLRYKYLAPTEEVLSLLETLRKGYYVALISNGMSNSQWEKIRRLHLAPYFDVILISGDMPWEKPNKKIFLEGCSRLGVSPEDCIMVGDKLETDILGAIQAGLGASVWVPLRERCINQSVSDIVPDFTIDDISELNKLLSINRSFNMHLYNSLPFCPDFEDSNSNGSDGS